MISHDKDLNLPVTTILQRVQLTPQIIAVTQKEGTWIHRDHSTNISFINIFTNYIYDTVID